MSIVIAIGWIGNAFLSFCGIPLLYDTWKNGAKTSEKFLFVWGLGEILSLAYVLLKVHDTPIMLNYLFNLTLIVSIFVLQRKNRNAI